MKKNIKYHCGALLIALSCMWITSCSDETGAFTIHKEVKSGTLRTLHGGYLCASASPDDSVRASENSAIVQGAFDLAESACSIIQHGHCWSKTDSLPTVSDTNSTRLGTFASGKRTFTSEFAKLAYGTPYFVRSYVIVKQEAFDANGKPTMQTDTGYNPVAIRITTKMPVNMWFDEGNMPRTAASGAVAFVIGNDAYVGLGANGFSHSNEFLRYDYKNNSWTSIKSFPGKARANAVAFVAGGKAYVGLGDNGTSVFNDFYEYDPILKQWTQIANYPGGNRTYAFAFGIDNYGYVGSGQTAIGTGYGYSQDMYRFDSKTKTWKQIADFSGGNRGKAIAMIIEGRAYVGFGESFDDDREIVRHNDWWMFDPSSSEGSWSQKQNINGQEGLSTLAAGFAISDRGFVGMGIDNTGKVNRKWYEYDIYNDKWKQKRDFANQTKEARKGTTTFAVGNMGFVVMGIDNEGNRSNEVWMFRP